MSERARESACIFSIFFLEVEVVLLFTFQTPLKETTINLSFSLSLVLPKWSRQACSRAARWATRASRCR